MGLRTWLKNLFNRKEPDPVKEYDKAVENFNEASRKLVGKVIDVGIDSLAKQPSHTRGVNYQPFVPRVGAKATKQDISKFMKHGRQASWYRKALKRK